MANFTLKNLERDYLALKNVDSKLAFLSQLYKPLTSRQRLLMFGVLLAFLFIFSTDAVAQSVWLTFDSEVACTDVNSDANNPKYYALDYNYENNTVCQRVCENSEVNYYVTGGQVLSWQAAGGTVLHSTQDSAKIEWGVAGNASVTIEVTRTDGTNFTKTICVEIVAAPAANFTILGAVATSSKRYNVCENTPVSFVSYAVPNGSAIVSYFWDFGDGSYSSEQNPTHTYGAGTYTVSLTVTNECNCSTVITETIVADIAKPSEIKCATVTCQGMTEKYWIWHDGHIGENCDIQWQVENGDIININSAEQYVEVLWTDVNSVGYGSVSAWVTPACTGGCHAYRTAKIQIVSINGKIQGEQQICIGEQKIYSLPQWATTDYVWSISPSTAILNHTGQRNEIAITAKERGVHTLRCDYINTLKGCVGSAEYEIIVKEDGYIHGNSVICNNTNAVFTLVKSNTTVTTACDWYLMGGDIANIDIHHTTSDTINLGVLPTGKYSISIENEEVCTKPFNFEVFSDLSDNTIITGERKICVGIPYEYSITQNNLPEGCVVEWQIQNGTFIGSNAGNTVSVIFTANTQNQWRISATVKRMQQPYCTANITLPLSQKMAGVTIEAVNVQNKFCPSSTSIFYLDNLPEGISAADIEWSVVPASFGSVGRIVNNFTHRKITFHEGASTGQIQVKIKSCGSDVYITKDIELYERPIISITDIDAQICSHNPFSITLSSNKVLSDINATFVCNGETKNFTFANTSTFTLTDLIINSNLSEIYEFPVTITITSSDFPCSNIVVRTDISVYPNPLIYVFPYNAQYIDNNPILTATFQTGFTQTAIKWYKAGNAVPVYSTSAGTVPSVLDVVALGLGCGSYYAESTSQYGCVTRSRTVNIYGCDSGSGGENNIDSDCPLAPDNLPQAHASLTLGSGFCGNVDLILLQGTANYGLEGSGWIYNEDDFVIIQQVSNPNILRLRAQHPGEFNFRYKYYYTPDCYVIIDAPQTITIPFIPHYVYKVTRCDLNNNTYSLLFENNSEYYHYYGCNPFKLTWIIDGVTHTAQNDTDTVTVALPQGYHTVNFNHTPVSGSSPNCSSCSTDNISINLPPIPNATFTGVLLDKYCINDTVVPKLIQARVDDYTYEWRLLRLENNSWNTVAINLMYNDLALTPNTIGSYKIQCTVTSPYGCADTYTCPPFTVRRTPVSGYVSGAEHVICGGQSVTLVYNQTPGSPNSADSYQWMNNDTQISDADGSTYTATQSGSYRVIVTPPGGCSDNSCIPFVLTVKQPPAVQVTHPDIVCQGLVANISIDISGLSGNGSYQLQKNDTVYKTGTFSKTTKLNYNERITDDTDYELIVTDNSTGCQTVKNFTIQASVTPDTPVLSYVITNSNPYTVQIIVDETYQTQVVEHYLWSNGGNGTSITTNHGGLFRVRAFNEHDCYAEAEIEIPKHPEEFIWIFPTGCADICRKDKENGNSNNLVLLGPSPFVHFTDWMWGVAPVLNGSGSVNDYTVKSSGIYNLKLVQNCGENPVTSVVVQSGDLSLNIIDCQECKFDVEMSIKDKTDDPYLYFTGTVSIFNPYPFDINITCFLPNTDGVLIFDSPLTLHPGETRTFNFEFIPNGNFLDMLAVTFEAYSPADKSFRCVSYTFTLCNEIASAPANNNLASGEVVFDIYPNPTSSNLKIVANLNKEAGTAAIYNINGKLLWQSAVKQSATFNVDVSAWAAASYIAVLKNAKGKIFKQQIFTKK